MVSSPFKVFVVMIFLSHSLEADIAPMMSCGVNAEIVEAKMHGPGLQALEVKVLEHWDVYTKKMGSCPFLQTDKNYHAQISSAYGGKMLRVPPLKPGQLGQGDKFSAFLTLANENDPIFWNMRENKKGLKEDTSFSTPHIKKAH